MKGDILDISENVNSFIFKIRVYTILASITCQSYNVKFEGIENYNNQNCTIVSFKIEKYSSEVYERDNDNVSYIPFQVAYAMSIHKAQGLEYDSVKIIISNEVEENISHNIFYTAITRARKNLTIYWSEETEHKVIESFSKISYKNDVSIIKINIQN